MRAEVAFVSVLLLGACGEQFSGKDEPQQDGGAGTGGDASTTPCTPGRSLPCVGQGQCDGFQECNDRGTGYGPCQCESGSGGASGAASSGGTGGNRPDTGDETGSAGAPAQITDRYVYWTSTTQALVQAIDPLNGEVTSAKQIPAPDPAATPGWTLRTFVPLLDGTAIALWTRLTGQAELWKLDGSLQRVAFVAYEHDPAGTFFGSAFRRLLDGTGRLVWHERASNLTRVWPLDANGGFEEIALGYTVDDPSAEWIPVHYTTLPEGEGLMLWAGAIPSGSTGTAKIWIMPNDDQPPTAVHVSHSAEYWARSLTVDPDGSIRIGLGSAADGAALVCGLVEIPADSLEVPGADGWGAGKCKAYAEPGMQFRGYVARW
jgi:hypothetical protein